MMLALSPQTLQKLNFDAFFLSAVILQEIACCDIGTADNGLLDAICEYFFSIELLERINNHFEHFYFLFSIKLSMMILS